MKNKSKCPLESPINYFLLVIKSKSYTLNGLLTEIYGLEIIDLDLDAFKINSTCKSTVGLPIHHVHDILVIFKS